MRTTLLLLTAKKTTTVFRTQELDIAGHSPLGAESETSPHQTVAVTPDLGNHQLRRYLARLGGTVR